MEWRINKELSYIKSLNSYKRPEKLQNYYKLDSNENLAIEKKFIKAIALKSIYNNDFREYPLEQFQILFDKIAKYVQLSTKNIGIGSGSDQIMDLLLSVISKAKRVITINPTFSYFKDRCSLYQIPLEQIELSTEDNSLDFENFINKSKNSDIVYLVSPNNPTSNQFKFDKIINLIETLKDKIIIIDEAYVEFSSYSLSSMVNKYNNLIIMRTFSKAFGLAGARIGYILANEEFIDLFNQYVQLPYPVSSFSMQIAIEVLENIEIIKKSITTIIKERKKIFDRLNQINKIKIYESNANFYFFQTFEYQDKIKKQLMDEKILVKNLGNIGNYKGAIRTTIGNHEVNDKVLSVIEKSFS